MEYLKILKKFINIVNNMGKATIKTYEPTKKTDLLCKAIVVTDNLIVWHYVLFADGTYNCVLMDNFIDDKTEYNIME